MHTAFTVMHKRVSQKVLSLMIDPTIAFMHSLMRLRNNEEVNGALMQRDLSLMTSYNLYYVY